MVKKIIKHNTCRRRAQAGSSIHKRRMEGHGRKEWRQTFTRGYIEQAFRKCCVREALLHGEANTPFLQRSDWKLKQKGVKAEKVVKEEAELPPTVRSRVALEMDSM